MVKHKTKVNLLTFNSALSYGAVLQTYALMKALEKLNCNVELIDYRAPFLPPIPTGLWSLRTNFNLSRLKKELLFRKFRVEHLSKKTKGLYSDKALRKYKFDADYFVVGSDQVWNPDITKKYALNYFFDFVKGNKISYAASFGKEEWNYPVPFTKEIKRLLSDFKSISVRESQAVSLMDENFNIKAEAVIDPTLLHTDFSDILPEFDQKQQIAVFKLKYDTVFLELAFQVQQILKYPAFAIDTEIQYKNITPIPFPSVRDWIKYIAESSFVITDSFHGVAFSIIFKKNFLVVNAHPKRFIRILDLLKKLGLQNQIVESKSDIIGNTNWLKPIDYNKVDKELSKLRAKSFNFLKAALNRKGQ